MDRVWGGKPSANALFAKQTDIFLTQNRLGGATKLRKALDHSPKHVVEYRACESIQFAIVLEKSKKGRGLSEVGVKKTGKGRRKIGRKKRRMRARIRHRKK